MADLDLAALTEAANKRLRAQGLGAPYVAPAALQNIVGAVLEALPRGPSAMLREFHDRFALSAATRPGIADVPEDLLHLRGELLKEEAQEYTDAAEVRDLVGIADALADVVYVAYGNALTYGIDLDAVLAEVHRSNMSKLGRDGRPVMREDGKVMKGPDYFPPDVAGVLGLDRVAGGPPIPAEDA